MTLTFSLKLQQSLKHHIMFRCRLNIVFLYKLWISNILATTMTEETCIVEMHIWCRTIGTVNVIEY